MDFDNVIARSIFPKPGIGEIMPGAEEALWNLQEQGWKVVVWTARPWSDYENIEHWLNDQNLPFSRIICGKPLVRWLIDDRNIEFNPKDPNQWKKLKKKIK